METTHPPSTGFPNREPAGQGEPTAGAAGFLSSLFSQLDARGIAYCVLRNFDDLPARVDDDLDLLVRPADLERIEQLLEEVGRGFLVARRTRRNDHRQLVLIDPAELKAAAAEERAPAVVELDFVTGLRWRGVTYLDAEQVLSRRQLLRGFQVPCEADQAAHLLGHVVLDKGRIRPDYLRRIRCILDSDPEGPFQALARFVGPRARRLMREAVERGSERLPRRRLLASLLLRRPAAIPAWLGFHLRQTVRRARLVLSPPGLLVATAGPDGAGKTTLLRRTRQLLEPAFDPVCDRYMGWKDFLLPTKRLLTLVRKTLIREKKESRSEAGGGAAGSSLHNLSVLHYFLDLWARYLFRIRPVLVRGGVVLCDRYFYDLLVQRAWICTNPRTRLLMLALVPSPSIVALLEGDPERIARRKDELTPLETAREIEAYSLVEGSGPPVVRLDTGKAKDHNALTVVRGLLDGPLHDRRRSC